MFERRRLILWIIFIASDISSREFYTRISPAFSKKKLP
jgi:hypothetical protein